MTNSTDGELALRHHGVVKLCIHHLVVYRPLIFYFVMLNAYEISEFTVRYQRKCTANSSHFFSESIRVCCIYYCVGGVHTHPTSIDAMLQSAYQEASLVSQRSAVAVHSRWL
jgi:hypothetical protein